MLRFGVTHVTAIRAQARATQFARLVEACIGGKRLRLLINVTRAEPVQNFVCEA
jgi:hypothetical protein